MDIVIDPLRDILATIARWLPQFVGALIVLLIGYIVARSVEKVIAAALKRAQFDQLITKGTAGSYIARVVPSPRALLGSVVFWLIWLGTLSLSVTILGVPALTRFVEAIYGYLPNVLAALLIFLAAGAVSTAAAGLANRLMGDTPTGKLVATIVPVVTMLIATFMILNQLQIAKEVVLITYAAIMGAVALGMALAFGLGGREVAGRLLGQAYERGQVAARQASRDAAVAKDRGHRAAGQL